MRLRTVTSTLTSALLVLALGACGGEADSEADGAPSESASAAPEESESPTEDATSEEPATGGAEAAAFLDRLKAGMGEEGSLHVEMKMTGPLTATAEGDTTYGPDGSEMRLTMQMSNMPDGAMEMVVVGDAAYMSIPGVTPEGKFFEVDQDNPMFSGFGQGMSPADSFKAFDAGLQEVQEVGTEEIDGEATTHYRLEVDAQKAMKASGQPMVPGLPETLSYDVWLDDQDRMRRLVYELAGTKLTMDMTDWGEDVSITAPDKSDIVKAPPTIGG